MDASVPFHASYNRLVPGGWISARVTGLVRWQPDGLVLELRERQDRVAFTDDPGEGGWSPGEGATTSTTIPLQGLTGVTLRGGRLRPPRLLIDVARLELLDPFPWAEGTRLTLALRRADRAAARELALAAEMALVDVELAHLEQG